MMQQRTISVLRTVDDRQVPLAGEYAIDQAHTSVEFVVRHMMISNVRGRFREVSGTITVDEVPERSHVEVDINAVSIDTGIGERDRHLRSPDFFDVERHPTIRFKSTKVELAPSGAWVVTGDLTILDVTRPVTLQLSFEGANASATGGERIAFSAAAEVNREDWGLTWNQALEAGGVLIGKKARIEINLEAVAIRPPLTASGTTIVG
jgi:polyisoprenoid-binding protein YceI